MFSVNHLIILTVCTALVTGSLVLSVRSKLSSRTASVIFLIICVVSEVLKDMCCMVPSEFGGCVLDHDDLPIHLCSVAVFAMIYVVFGSNEKVRSCVICAVAVGGTVAPLFALLLPTEGVAFNNVLVYQYFIYHAALLWYSLYHIISGKVDLGFRAYMRNIIYVSFALVIVLYINSALSVYGVNFGFLREPPLENLPLLNLNHGWHFYFIILVLICYLSVTAVHAPALIKSIIKKVKNKAEKK